MSAYSLDVRGSEGTDGDRGVTRRGRRLLGDWEREIELGFFMFMYLYVALLSTGLLPYCRPHPVLG
jgi:hypothetical protein